jgi:hypothetical protein
MIKLIVCVALIVGYVMCIYKCINSDWKPPYKREAVYGISAIIGLGGIVGYFNIEDEVTE